MKIRANNLAPRPFMRSQSYVHTNLVLITLPPLPLYVVKQKATGSLSIQDAE